MIRRAAHESRAKASQLYADHIETAFKAFIQEPSESTLERFQWLKAKQRVIQKLSTWPLTLTHTLVVVVGANALLALVILWFLHRRLSLPLPGVLTGI